MCYIYKESGTEKDLDSEGHRCCVAEWVKGQRGASHPQIVQVLV